MNTFVTHLVAAIDGTRLPYGQRVGVHADRPVRVRYHLDKYVAVRIGRWRLDRRRVFGVRRVDPVERGRPLDPLTAAAKRHFHQTMDVGQLRVHLLAVSATTARSSAMTASAWANVRRKSSTSSAGGMPDSTPPRGSGSANHAGVLYRRGSRALAGSRPPRIIAN